MAAIHTEFTVSSLPWHSPLPLIKSNTINSLLKAGHKDDQGEKLWQKSPQGMMPWLIWEDLP